MTTQDDLFFERTRLRDHEEACEKLINMIDDGDELDMSTDMATVTMSVLGVLQETISKRVMVVDNLIEAGANKTMNRFRRREIV